MPKALNLTGSIYGYWTVIKENLPKTKPRKWVCTCICGTTKPVSQANLRSTTSTNCGCIQYASKITHGSHNTRLYTIFWNIIQRCNNSNYPRFKDWGGRGIKVDDTWLYSFITFEKWALTNGYSKELSLDRKNNNGNYTPDNCRWVTKITQSRNRRKKSTKTTSKYIGVSKYKPTDKVFTAEIVVNKQKIYLGRFTQELDAAIARDTYIIQNNLKNFTLNNVLGD